MEVLSSVQCAMRCKHIYGDVLPHAGIRYCSLYVAEPAHERGGVIHSCVVLVLKRVHGETLEDRLRLLRSAMTHALLPDERLEYRDRAMVCAGKGYEIVIVVEAYKKRPSLTAFFDGQGVFHAEPLHRMPMFEAIKRAKALTGMLTDWNIAASPFADFLDEPGLVDRFPNAADRFAFLARRETQKSPRTYAELMALFR